MKESLFEAVEPKSVAIRDEAAVYPVRRIFCVGRNYAAHAAEMGFEVDREEPFYFTKSATALEASGSTLPYPPGTGNLHHEMELVIAMGKPAFRKDRKTAIGSVFGYACGLDMTRRDLQIAAREKKRPWDLGKDFEGSAIVGTITPAVVFGEIGTQRIKLEVNGEIRQDSQLSDLIWKVPEIISHLSLYYHLDAGDLIFTGTPAGVGPVVAGDVIVGEIEGLDAVRLTISDAE